MRKTDTAEVTVRDKLVRMMKSFNQCRVTLTLAVLVAAAVAGCGEESKGPPLGQVEGIVTLGGKPLENATVIFRPERGRESTAVTDSRGHYSLTYKPGTKGAIVGKHQVSISTRTEFFPRELVPAQYHRENILTANVESGANSIDFQLESTARTR